jgi:hypothetical protein
LPPCIRTSARDPSDAVAPLHGPQPTAFTILTMQILGTSGFLAAKFAALRALSDITGRYITSCLPWAALPRPLPRPVAAQNQTCSIWPSRSRTMYLVVS